jgi:hypothetical protein
MKIEIHEWPLPQSKLAAESTVFELDVPPVIRNWRDITYQILVDILSEPQTQKGSNKKRYFLYDYKGIQQFISARADRLQFVSSV